MTPTRALFDVRRGDWREVLTDEDLAAVDVWITDVPYSARTVDGYRGSGDFNEKGKIDYSSWDSHDAAQLVAAVTGSAAHWFVGFGDHVVWGWLERWLGLRGWKTSAPVIWHGGVSPRIDGRGPSSECEHIMIARPPREVHPDRMNSRRGFYDTPRERSATKKIVVGQKPLPLMRALVRDYALPGDVVIDPFAGSGTTLAAALVDGCRVIGCEVDEARHAYAVQRCADVDSSPDMFSQRKAPPSKRRPPKSAQGRMFGDD